jgi:hypothetical protein
VFTVPIPAFTMSDPDVHVAPIHAFTFDRSERSAWTAARTQVIDDQQRDGRELGEGLLAGAGELRLGKVLEQDVRLAVEHPMALLNDSEADSLGKMALPGAGTP